jgi:hypothetical protein
MTNSSNSEAKRSALQNSKLPEERQKINETYHFNFRGTEIKQGLLKSIWEEIKKELMAKGYSVQDSELPRVRAFRLKFKEFNKKLKELRKSPNIRDKGEEEYGEKEKAGQLSSAFALPLNDQEWIIFKCDGLFPLKDDLKHELTHVWEHTLRLKWGTLTNER